MSSNNKFINAFEYGGITCLRYSGNGLKLVGGTSTGIILVWDGESFELVAKLEGHTDNVTDICFVKEELLASCSHDMTAILWSLQDSSIKFCFRGHQSWLRSVDWYGNKILTCGGDKELKLWDIESGYNVATSSGHKDWVKRSHFHVYNPSIIVSCSFDKTVRSWEVDGGKNIHTVELSSAVRCLVDCTTKLGVVAGCVDGSVHLIDMAEGVVLVQLLGPQDSGKPTNVVRIVGCDELIVAGTSSGTVFLWGMDGTEMGIMDAHTDFVADLSIAPDGTCISGDGTGKVLVWDVHNPSQDPIETHILEDKDDICLCCASEGNDELTSVSCGTQNGKLCSYQLQSHEVGAKQQDELTEEVARQRHSTLVAGGVYADWFQKKGGKTLGIAAKRKRRLCVVEGFVVRYYESIDSNNNPKGLKGTIKIYEDSSVEIKDNRLLIRNPDRTWDLECESQDILTRWSAKLSSIVATLKL
eukprot:m.78677 g.78677  ORF g.78677 m.78677 type:complete len:471 (-) comp11962_c0_seq2:40-1452(-)